jgi:hypothetical protein
MPQITKLEDLGKPANEVMDAGLAVGLREILNSGKELSEKVSNNCQSY